MMETTTAMEISMEMAEVHPLGSGLGDGGNGHGYGLEVLSPSTASHSEEERKRRVEEWICFVNPTAAMVVSMSGSGVSGMGGADLAATGDGLDSRSGYTGPSPPPSTSYSLESTPPISRRMSGSMSGCGTGGPMSSKGHVFSLPTELLATIFEMANEEDVFLGRDPPPPSQNTTELTVVEENPCTRPLDRWEVPVALAVSQTCARWRGVALGTTGLWSKISIYRQAKKKVHSGANDAGEDGPTVDEGGNENPLIPGEGKRWNLARLWLARATRTHVSHTSTSSSSSTASGAGASSVQIKPTNRGILDIKIFGVLYKDIDWSEKVICEKWFGKEDMSEICDFLLPYSPLFRTITLSTDAWEPIHTFLYRSSFLRARNLERVEFVRANTFPGKGDVFGPSGLGAPIRLFSGVPGEEGGEEGKGFEEGCLGKLKEVVLNGVHVDWEALLGSMITRAGDSLTTPLQTLYLNYLAWNVRPSLSIFCSMITASPDLGTLCFQCGGFDPEIMDMVEFEPHPARYQHLILGANLQSAVHGGEQGVEDEEDIRGGTPLPWDTIIPPSHGKGVLEKLHTMTLKWTEVDHAVGVLVVLRALRRVWGLPDGSSLTSSPSSASTSASTTPPSHVNSLTSRGRLNALKCLHIGNVSGRPEWDEEEIGIAGLVWMLGRVLPWPSSDASPTSPATGVTSLSLTGFIDHFADPDLYTPDPHYGQLGPIALPPGQGGIKEAILGLLSLEVWCAVKSLRVVFCGDFLWEGLRPGRVLLSGRSPKILGPFPMQCEANACLEGLEGEMKAFTPMPRLEGVYIADCPGTGVPRDEQEGPLDCIKPLGRMLTARHAWLSLLAPSSSPPPVLKVLGFAHHNGSSLNREAVSMLRPYVQRVEWWGREPGQLEVSSESEGTTEDDIMEEFGLSQWEIDEMLIQDAEDAYDPEFEFLCETAIGKDDDEEEVETAQQAQQEGMEEMPLVVGAGVPFTGEEWDPEVDGEEEDDFEFGEETLPTPRNPHQTFFGSTHTHSPPNTEAYVYHHYLTGEDISIGPTSTAHPILTHPSTFVPRHDLQPTFSTCTDATTTTTAESIESLDIDCGASTSDQTSTALSSPSTSTTSLPTSTAPSEAASSVCGDHEPEREGLEPSPGSDDTLSPYGAAKMKVGMMHIDDDFEVDAY